MEPLLPTVADYLMIAIVGGVPGAVAMYGLLRILNAAGWVNGDIIVAIGDTILHRREKAFQVGLLIHFAAAMAFAPLYLLILSSLGMVELPFALIGGAVVGMIHGIFVSLAFVWVSCNQPMLPEFTGARIPLGVMHCAGHLAYGVVVGTAVAAVISH